MSLFETGFLLFEIGLLIILTMGTSIVLKKLGIPSVVGLIIGGMLINILIDVNTLVTDFLSLEVIITEMALAYIGYKIGYEIDLNVLRSKGKGFIYLLLAESIGAFLIISIGIFLITQKLSLSFILGSIGMATAPAATTLILQETGAKGELTQSLLFVIAFDDTLAVLFVTLSLDFIGHEGENIFQLFSSIIIDIALDLALAVSIAIIGVLIILSLLKTNLIIKKSIVEWLFSTALVLVGLGILFEVNTILVMFIWGFLINYIEKHNSFEQLEKHIEKVEILSFPIISLFFILVGLLMKLELIFEIVTFFLALTYFIFRLIGKGFGSYLAAYKLKFDINTVKNLPLSLFNQAGVAIGLASLSYRQLFDIGREAEGLLILNIIGVSVILGDTFISPYMLKRAIYRSGEAF